MRRQLPKQSIVSAPKFAVTKERRDGGWKVLSAVGTCHVCGAPFDPFDGDMVEHLAGRCGSEDCMVESLIRLRISGRSQPWVKLRAPTADYNVARKHFREHDRPTLAGISAARRRRIDEVKRRFEAGESPAEIAGQMGHRGQAVYSDLRDAGCDVSKSKPATQAAESKGRLLERIATLIESGLPHSAVALLVNLSASMVGYHARRLVKSGRLTASTQVGRNRTTQ